MRPLLALALGLLVCTSMAPPAGASFNGADSWAPANKYDAPIFRQFAFVEGTVTMYHVLKPHIFRTDDHHSNIYQFPECPALRPVLEHHADDHDAPTRHIVDVHLLTGCATQPTSEADLLRLAAAGAGFVPRGMYVNAPKMPPGVADLPDEQLFNGPPYRPRVTAWEEGRLVKLITYEASWLPSWLGTNFPAKDADVFIISYGPIFQPGFSVLNVAAGSPHHPTFRAYSPIWAANCIVKATDPVCGSSVHKPDYEQCYSVSECTSLPGVTIVKPGDFTHINCPMVAVDLTRDNYIAEYEELVFPNLWVHGPVTLA